MGFWSRDKIQTKLRVIKTARDLNSINKSALRGFRPMVKKVVPSDDISSKYSVLQNKKTGKIKVIGDFRSIVNEDEFETVIDWTSYYPHNFKSPFAAYLIPKDISLGERVFIEDLIEDFVGISWNQGDNYRLGSCEAIWNGTDLEIQYDPRISRAEIVG